jgi:lysophospholipase L1-like esterase
MGDTSFPAHAVFNLGVSGDTSAGLAARLERELEPRRLGDQTIVVIAIGVNETAFDPGTGRPAGGTERFAATLAELVAAARRHTDQVLLVGLLPCDEARMQPPPWSEDGGEHYANDRIGQFNQAVHRVAADAGPPWPTASRRRWPATTRPCCMTGCTQRRRPPAAGRAHRGAAPAVAVTTQLNPPVGRGQPS